MRSGGASAQTGGEQPLFCCGLEDMYTGLIFPRTQLTERFDSLPSIATTDMIDAPDSENVGKWGAGEMQTRRACARIACNEITYHYKYLYMIDLCW